jgi:hypothetical protein
MVGVYRRAGWAMQFGYGNGLEMELQVRVRGLAAGPRGLAPPGPIPEEGPRRQGGPGERPLLRDASAGQGPAMHCSPGAAARPRAPARMDPHRRPLEPRLPRRGATLRRDGESPDRRNRDNWPRLCPSLRAALIA